MLDNFGGATPPGTFTLLQIHLDAYATTWGNARKSFYGVTGTPHAWFDGVTEAIGSYQNITQQYNWYQSIYNARRAVATDVTIQLAGGLLSENTYEVQANVGIEAGGTGKTMRIYLAQVLDLYPIPPSYSRYCFIQPAVTYGSEDVVSVTPGQVQVVTRNFILSGASLADVNNVKIVAWAQHEPLSSGKEVYQAAVMPWPFTPLVPPPGDMDGSLAVDLDDIDDFVQALVDPDGYASDPAHAGLDPVALGDLNEDGLLDGNDIYPFMSLVIESMTEDIWPPAPDPMTFAVFPAPASTASVSMTATTAIDAMTPPVPYLFTFVSGGSGGTSSAWQTSTSYTDSGLVANTAYIYNVKARDSAATPNVTAPSSNAATATYIQTPTSVSFGTVTSNSIVLNATGTLTNLTTGSSGVYFDSITPDGDGGINAWVQVATDTATGLSPDTTYTFAVKARNQNSVETIYSPTANKVTLANVPSAPTLGDATTSTMTLDVNANGNPAVTVFAIQCTSTTQAEWNGLWVDASGNASATPVWRTDAQWAVTLIQGLQPATSYTFAAKARNLASVETALGPSATLSTIP